MSKVKSTVNVEFRKFSQFREDKGKGGKSEKEDERCGKRRTKTQPVWYYCVLKKSPEINEIE